VIEYEEGRTRIVIEGVTPEIDGGRFPIKRIVGDRVVIEADIFADGHDVLSPILLYRKGDDQNWTEAPMEFLINDCWSVSFVLTELGQYRYTLTAWVDRFKTWRQDMLKKVKAKQDVSADFVIGAQLIEEASQCATERADHQ
jgi:starch synthase (maltosyl-transferring)